MSEEKNVISLDVISKQVTSFTRDSFQITVLEAEELINKANEIEVKIDDKKSYDEAKNLYSKTKDLWVKVRKDKELINKNLREIIDKVKDYSDEIYNPLQQSGEKLKSKMKPYEEEVEKRKKEKAERELAEQKRKEEIAKKLVSLNSDFLTKIQSCETIEEINEIKGELENYDVSIFEEQSPMATFTISQLVSTCSIYHSNLIMKIEQEKMRKQEEERIAEQKRKEDEELKANQEKIAQKLKEEEEEKEAKRKAELEALAKIKQEEEEKLKLEQESACIKPQETTNSIENENSCPTSKIDVEQDEKQSLVDNETFVETVSIQTSIKKPLVKLEVTPFYNEMLKELFEREIEWFIKNNSSITNEQFAITLAQIVEQQKEIIFNS